MTTPFATTPRFFPSPEQADEHGIIAVGGKLSTAWLVDAYRHGIFPWPMFDMLLWWSPDPRGVLEFDSLHVSRRLRQTCRGDRFQVTFDRDFAGVIQGCATAQDRVLEGTWLTPTMRRAYLRLHELGRAHSVETWRDGRLAGGVYGVAIGGMFAAESMFHFERDASKVALVALVDHLRRRGFSLIDVQQVNPHTTSLGATEIPRAEFLSRLAAVRDLPIEFAAHL